MIVACTTQDVEQAFQRLTTEKKVKFEEWLIMAIEKTQGCCKKRPMAHRELALNCGK